jgi:site-specific DNA-adenine methylase
MQYLGGKFRISKPLSEFLNQQMTEDDTFVDLFCGSLNISVNVKSKNIILNDKHRYLMRCGKNVSKDGFRQHR